MASEYTTGSFLGGKKTRHRECPKVEVYNMRAIAKRSNLPPQQQVVPQSLKMRKKQPAKR